MGMGYIGLPTAALIASRGIDVLGVDINQKVIETINKGGIHIVEPALDGLVKNVVERKLLKASTTASEADVHIIAVPTPFKGNHEPDLKYIESATNMIIPHLKEGNLFIIESTSPVGTTQRAANLIYSKRPELKGKLYIAFCPERVLPGKIIYELRHNDRVIGGLDDASTKKAIDFYRQFVIGDLHSTNARTAEMCKLVENASRDSSIAFANELSMICDKANINVWELIKLANKHPRINILQPGTGVGGHCIAVDPWFIVSGFKNESNLIKQARDVNNFKTQWVIEKIRSTALQFELENQKKATIACMGLAFKPNIDDLRESPALQVANALINDANNDILLVEPNINNESGYEITDHIEAINKADIIVYLVAHKEFKGLQTNSIQLDFCGVNI